MRSLWGVIFSTALMLCSPAQAGCRLDAPTAAKAGAGCAGLWMGKHLKLNDIVTVGTHNSYKQAIGPGWMRMIKMGSSKDARSMDYSFPPIADQLADGARALDFHIVNDPKGGTYARPASMKYSDDPLPDGYAQAMSKPGFKVMRLQDVDFRSSCLTLVDCLTIVRDWSRANPHHTPLLVTIQTRDDEVSMSGSVTPVKFEEKTVAALDAEILSVFDPKDIITPDAVRGKYQSLREAVLAGNWPSLAAARGKIILALTTPRDLPEFVNLYVGNGPIALKDRVMFAMAEEASPAAAIIRVDDPIKDKERIAEDVKAGFIVRTRADAATEEARKNDTARRDAALAGGAQYVVTDYMQPDKRFGPYQVRMPTGSITQCNPLRAAAACEGAPVEPATALQTAEH